MVEMGCTGTNGTLGDTEVEALGALGWGCIGQITLDLQVWGLGEDTGRITLGELHWEDTGGLGGHWEHWEDTGVLGGGQNGDTGTLGGHWEEGTGRALSTVAARGRRGAPCRESSTPPGALQRAGPFVPVLLSGSVQP